MKQYSSSLNNTFNIQLKTECHELVFNPVSISCSEILIHSVQSRDEIFPPIIWACSH